MKFGIFYEHQLPRPWGETSELKLFQFDWLQPPSPLAEVRNIIHGRRNVYWHGLVPILVIGFYALIHG